MNETTKQMYLRIGAASCIVTQDTFSVPRCRAAHHACESGKEYPSKVLSIDPNQFVEP